jgi:hypothetical protein
MPIITKRRNVTLELEVPAGATVVVGEQSGFDSPKVRMDYALATRAHSDTHWEAIRQTWRNVLGQSTVFCGWYYPDFEYRLNRMVVAKLNPDTKRECAGGIHAFLRREDADAFNG